MIQQEMCKPQLLEALNAEMDDHIIEFKPQFLTFEAGMRSAMAQSLIEHLVVRKF